MSLEALLLSQDREVVRVIHRVLGDLDVIFEDCTSMERGAEVLHSRKFDAVLIDCDDLHGAPEVLKQVRKETSNRSAIVFAIINGVTSVRAAFDLGANFVLDKPLTVERVSRSLRAAHGLMMRERRRYFRQPVEMPIVITAQSGAEIHAGATNLSEGGMAVQSAQAIPTAGPMRVRFTLPGTRVTIEARAEIAWTDGARQSGLRFQHIHQTAREDMERWLAERVEKEEPAPLFINASRPIVRVRGTD